MPRSRHHSDLGHNEVCLVLLGYLYHTERLWGAVRKVVQRGFLHNIRVGCLHPVEVQASMGSEKLLMEPPNNL